MKKLMITGIVILILSGCSTQQKKSPLEGAWRLVHEYQKSGDKVVAEFPVNITGAEMKVWTEKNFMFVGQFKQDTIITDNYGGGTYKMDGNNYEETIEFHSYPSFLGKTMKILIEIKGDTITQTFPLDENGKVIESEYYIEKWARIK
jgi:hypothetical protein